MEEGNAQKATGPWRLRDGTPVYVRRIRPGDQEAMVAFHHALSDESVYNRYAELFKLPVRVASERLRRICEASDEGETVLVAEAAGADGDVPAILAVARLNALPGTDSAEFAIVIRDSAQGRGLGTELLRRLIAIARVQGLRQILGEILTRNVAMIRVCEKMGFRIERSQEVTNPMVRAVYDVPGSMA